jgi:hypothetical protein
MKATLVQAESVATPSSPTSSYRDPYNAPQPSVVETYPELKLPNGMDATTGESLQTPERLKDMEGVEGAFCIFGRLSIRMPGLFRLRFTLYQTVE